MRGGELVSLRISLSLDVAFRHFAMGELKIYLGLILSYATIELDPSFTSRPKLFMARMGVGVMPPDGDMRVKIHRRTDV